MMAQVVLTPNMEQVLLAGMVALQVWLVQRSFALERRVALLNERLNSRQRYSNGSYEVT